MLDEICLLVCSEWLKPRSLFLVNRPMKSENASLRTANCAPVSLFFTGTTIKDCVRNPVYLINIRNSFCSHSCAIGTFSCKFQHGFFLQLPSFTSYEFFNSWAAPRLHSLSFLEIWFRSSATKFAFWPSNGFFSNCYVCTRTIENTTFTSARRFIRSR